MTSVQKPKPHGAPIHEKRLLPVQPPGQAVGRNRELASMHVQIKAGGSLMLYGPAGIGKTALATVLATAQIASNPGGVLWFTLAEDDLIALATRVGRAYDEDTFTAAGGDWDKASTRVRDLLTKRRPLIVLDGIVDTNSAREFIRQCAPNTPFILMSERAAPGPWTPIELKPLPAKDAQSAFRLYSGLSETGNTHDIEALCAFLDGYPLTLELAGRYCATHRVTAGEFLASLPGGGGASTQRTVLSAVFKRLDTASQGIMLVLSATATGAASLELLSMATRLSPQDALQHARKLTAQGVTHEYPSYGQVRFALHDAAYQFARHWLTNYQRLEGIEARVMQSVLTYAERYAQTDAAGRVAAQDRLADEIDNIVGMAALAAQQGKAEVVTRLLTALEDKADDFILERHFWLELSQLKELASMFPVAASPLPSVAAVPTVPAAPTAPISISTSPPVTVAAPAIPASPALPPDLPPAAIPEVAPEPTQPAPALTLSSLRATLSAAPPPAITQPANPTLEIAPPLETAAALPPRPTLELDAPGSEPGSVPDSELAALREVPNVRMGIDVPELAAAQDTEHHTPPSVATIRDMLAEARAKGEKRREALLLQSLGQHNMDMGRVPEAIDFFKQALVAFETVNDSDGMLASLDVLASLAAHAGNTQEALVFATRGVNFAGQINDKTRLGKLMLRLGDIRLTLGEVASAIDTYQKAVETLRSTEAWVSIGVAMTKLGRAQLQGQRPEDARQVLEPALAIFRKERRADHEARALGELGRAYTALQAWREAEEHHEQALMLAREQFDQVTEAEQYVALGYLHELLNDREGAILFYRRALHTAYQVEDVAMQVACAIQLGEFLVEDTRTLNQAVLLLREANEKRPSAQAERLLKRADQRLRRAASAGLNIPPAGTSNRAYAAEAYVA